MTPAAHLVPLLIRARLATGVACAVPWGVALDGLLASEIWAERKTAARAAGQAVPGLAETPELEDLDLPLARCAMGPPGLWHWAATCAFPEGLASDLPDVRYWTGQLDARACEQTAAALPMVVPGRQGRYRSRRMPLLVTVCTAVTWHAVGDPDVIRRILAGLMAIGKKRSCGEGRVLSWEVTPCPLSPWQAAHLHPDGTLGRPAPASCLAGTGVTAGGSGTAGLRPPYMHPARQATVLLPVSPAG
jgi:CRISPR type IV-associated protein Csf3